MVGYGLVWPHLTENLSNCDLPKHRRWWLMIWQLVQNSRIPFPLLHAHTQRSSHHVYIPDGRKGQRQKDTSPFMCFLVEVFSWRSPRTSFTNISLIRTMSRVPSLGGKGKSFFGCLYCHSNQNKILLVKKNGQITIE